MKKSESSSKEIKDVISYHETDLAHSDDVKVTVTSGRNESSELVVERFSTEEIDIFNRALTNFKNKLVLQGL